MDLIERAAADWRDFRRGLRAPDQAILHAMLERAQPYLPVLEAIPGATRTMALFVVLAADQDRELEELRARTHTLEQRERCEQ